MAFVYLNCSRYFLQIPPAWRAFAKSGKMEMLMLKKHSKIHCQPKLQVEGSSLLLSVPPAASKQLPSKGMVFVRGSLNHIPFSAVLEPNGQGGHWFKPKNSLLKKSGAQAGNTVSLEMEPDKNWPEPKVPEDLKKALAHNPAAHAVWQGITPMARWDFIRWITSAKQQDTRTRRVTVACSKLKGGKRRPCCFDRTQCTLTDA